ncbi:MAG: hypothetical protein CMJ76_12525 [Planctomycetaceae bacterium]|nr:hypothetical protein [Planctomycetaceae bacterium]
MNSEVTLIEHIFSPPLIVSTGLVIFVVLYWIISVLTGLGLDAIDFDLDFDTDADVGGLDGFMGIGLLPLKWLNIGTIPLMLWFSIFAMCFFFASLGVEHYQPLTKQASTGVIGFRVVWVMGLGALSTKFVTQPMREWFKEHILDSNAFVGKQATTRITTHTTRGKIFIERKEGDLISEARTAGEEIPDGTRVTVVSYDEAQKVYIVAESRSTGEETINNKEEIENV